MSQLTKQEPVAYVAGYHDGCCVIEPLNRALVLPQGVSLYAAPCSNAVEAERQRDEYKADAERYFGILERCRPSVKADLIRWEQFLLRKAGACNQCDHDETQRVHDLLAAIDTALAAKKEKA